MVVQPEANLPHHYMPSCPLVRINSTTCTVVLVGKPLRVPHEHLRVDTVPYTWVRAGLEVRDQDGRLAPGWKWTAWTVAEHLAHSAPDRAMPRPRLVIVPCGGAKLDYPAPAGDLYTGSYHRVSRAAAAALEPTWTFILSARHGLLPLNKVVVPYEQRMGESGAVDDDWVRIQARAFGLLDVRDVIVLGGRAYAGLARRVWPHAQVPLDGAGGLLRQMAALARMARPSPADDLFTQAVGL